MLLSSFTLMRKVLALAVVLIISAAAPATAVIGFCAKMPCCFGEAAGGPVLAMDMADCCSTISCYEGPSNDLTLVAQAKVVPPATTGFLPLTPTVPPLSPRPFTFDDTSPPPTTSERLSSLSVFLI